MIKSLTLASALALALAAAAPEPAAAASNGERAERGDDDRGRGRGDDDRGRGRGGDDDRGRGRGGDDDRGRPDWSRGRSDDRRGEERRGREIERAWREADRRSDDRARWAEAREREIERRFEDRRREVQRARERPDDRRDWERRGDGDRIVAFFTRDRDRDWAPIRGCPPGLAWRNNGCLPPGQARRVEREWRDDWRRYDAWWDRRRDDNHVYRYDDGYLYRLTNSGSLLGYVPVLGGALWTGQPWPERYAYEPAPRYLTNYYRLNDPYDWRYADGVVYGVDPQTQAIQQVVALVTGQPWTVGQRMPSGYDVYNLPYAYRGQYVDTPDRWYRYSDGYVYQVDPTTRLVQAVIQLLT